VAVNEPQVLTGIRWRPHRITTVDLDRKQLSIRHTLVRGEKERRESSRPKTGKCQRTIAISVRMVDMLKAPKVKHAERQMRTSRTSHMEERAQLFGLHRSRRLTGQRERSTGAFPRVDRPVEGDADPDPRSQAHRGDAKMAMTLDLYSHVSMRMQAAERVRAVISSARDSALEICGYSTAF